MESATLRMRAFCAHGRVADKDVRTWPCQVSHSFFCKLEQRHPIPGCTAGVPTRASSPSPLHILAPLFCTVRASGTGAVRLLALSRSSSAEREATALVLLCRWPLRKRYRHLGARLSSGSGTGAGRGCWLAFFARIAHGSGVGAWLRLLRRFVCSSRVCRARP